MGDEILLAHGSGGRLSMELIRQEILSRFGEGPLSGLPDAATVPLDGGRLVFTTDSYVVKPLFFPGGNIGHLAVHGTVNDLAVAGGGPRWLSLGLILEEGLSMEVLRQVLDSVRDAAAACGVTVATGDTKVVSRGQADGMYINTSGVGEAVESFTLGPAQVRPGDRVLVSGTVGDHGMAVMAAREGINIRNGPESDTAPVHGLTRAIESLGPAIRFMRDPTRGGLSAVLNEIVSGQDFGIELEEDGIPFAAGTRAVAEMLGVDLLHVASEGRVVCVCGPRAADAVKEKWRARPEGAKACVVGTVNDEAGRVTLKTVIGSRRMVDVPHGELLPRIC
jgi:hydrogenase expression/formation protein HypE